MKKSVWGVFHTLVILSILGITANAQPAQVTEIPPNSTNFSTIGNLVYFTVGTELWRTDGTAEGTFSIKSDVHPLSVRHFYEFRDMLFFPSAKHPDQGRVSWRELWRTDGTVSGTVLIKSSADYDIAIAGNTEAHLYFGASEAMTGYELYRTNGAAGSTTLVMDINPGVGDGFIGLSKSLGDYLFFAGDDGEHGTELWKTSSATGTQMVKDINPGSGNGFISASGGAVIGDESYYATQDRFYFTGFTSATGGEPWVSDGSDAGTVLLNDITSGAEGTDYIAYKIEHNGHLFFITKPPFETWEDEAATADLWKTVGSPQSTLKVKELSSATETFDNPFWILRDKIAFFSMATATSTGPHQLWISDGTTSGTQVIFNLQDYAGTRQTLSFADIVNDHLLFYNIHDGIPTPFFRSDGTSVGTQIFTRFMSGAYLIEPRDVTKVGDLVFYGDHDGPSENGYPQNPEDYYQLIQTDGFLTQSVRDLHGGSYSGTFDIVDYNGKAVFTTFDENQDPSPTVKKLWIFDPSVQPSSRFTLVDADTDKDLQRINDNDVIQLPDDVNFAIRFNPMEPAGSVVFSHSGAVVRHENAAPYSLSGDVNGDYSPWTGTANFEDGLTAAAYSGSGGTGTLKEEVTIHFKIERSKGNCAASGTILREYWDNVSGNSVSSIPVATAPTSTSELTIFETPTETDTNFGARISGYICPPVTGNYTFWIASNDLSELWLSTDEDPANKRRIAYANGATNPRQWDKFSTQKSTSIALSAGQTYFIEALHKQGAGTAHVAVGWQLPDGTLERPIAGNRLSPAEPTENSLPVVEILAPDDGQVFNPPISLSFNVSAIDQDGSVTVVEFFSNGEKLGEDHTPSEGYYNYIWQNIPPGTHSLTAKATDNSGGLGMSSPVTITVTGDACMATGSITRDYWANVSGSTVSTVPVDRTPTTTTEISIFEGPSNVGVNYASRIRGYICPPMTGNFTFWIASNDHSELWLSSDENPANKVRIAYVTGATGPREWTKYSSQRSQPVSMTQGRRYYIEALHKQGAGTDHLAVGWMLPNNSTQRPIPGMHLSPFEGSESATTAFGDNASSAESYSQISVYPNPATGNDRQLTISGYQGIDEAIETYVEILNMTGEVVFADRIRCGGDCSSYLLKINKQLVPGVYLVNLKTKNARLSKRLLVK